MRMSKLHLEKWQTYSLQQQNERIISNESYLKGLKSDMAVVGVFNISLSKILNSYGLLFHTVKKYVNLFSNDLRKRVVDQELLIEEMKRYSKRNE